ncbi:TetR/AcrR family transcriptional regulator [Streptomyces sp. NPDC017979]|uniref:TetR/AcrR family transcriptional regulator n=1 Tax=Streptomyces sp. NPDC017979 TaxID=3365024 RepID=UPI0037B7D82C
MPTARESLLSAALLALDRRPWSAVRMVDVAAAAGVSRQTLYNEFGGKDGLARALVRREADAYFHGMDRLLYDRPGYAPPGSAVLNGTGGNGAGVVDRLVAVAEWTVAQARARPLLRALLTGCWGEQLPAPGPVGPGAPQGGAPAQRRADAGPPDPADLAAAIRDRSLAALSSLASQSEPASGRGGGRGTGGSGRTPEEVAVLAYRCEVAVRLALSYVVAPDGAGVGSIVRTAVGRPF